METSCLRYDFAPITGSELTDEGYLRVWARTARTGTQVYRRADGSEVREYRPPEEVSNPESLASFGMKPATWLHPPALLDASNTKKFQVGYSGSQVRYNDGFVEVAVVVTDADSIEKIKRGDAAEVSAGYRVDYDPTPGISPEGESYDGVQRNIRVNHIAIVPRGRAGPEVRLLLDRLDAADAVALPPEGYNPPPSSSASPLMATVKLDGLEIEIPAEAATAVQSYVRDTARQLTASTEAQTALQSKLDSLQADFDALAEEKEAAEGRADALEEALEEAQSDSADPSRIDTAELDKLVSARLAVLQQLAPAFESSFKFDGISSDDLYLQAYTNLTGKKPGEDASLPYLQGVVEGILETRAALDADDPEDEDDEEEMEEEKDDMDMSMKKDSRGDSTASLRSALRGVQRKDSSKSPVVTHHAKRLDDWKRPLTATK
jgi:hypothetical protein